MPKQRYYSTTEAAAELGYTNDAYIRRIILRGKLRAKKLGRDWLISQKNIDDYRINQKLAEVEKDIIANPEA